MKKYLNYTLLFLLVASISCSRSTKETGNRYDYDLIISEKKLEIPIDSLTPFESTCIKGFQENDRSYLVFLNSNFSKIDFYNLENQSLYKRIHLKNDGPNGVGRRVFGFEVFSMDSIFLSSSNMNLNLINSDGEVLDKIPYININEGIGLLQITSTYNKNLAFKNGLVYGYTGLVGDPSGWDQNQLSKWNIEVQIDPSTKGIKLLPITYPNDYFQEGIKNWELSRIYDGKKFIYSFCADHYLYSTTDFSTITKTLAKSDYFEKISSMSKNIGISEYQKYLIENPSYKSLVYDKYREVYYRFCDLATEFNENDNVEKIIKYRPKQSIVILDKDLKKIGEKLLPEKSFKLDNYFIVREGLYISNNTPFNKDMSEDVLSFTLFTLTQI